MRLGRQASAAALLLAHLMCAAGTGAPQVRRIAPAEYGAAPENYDITQDTTGRLYVANRRGVLIFDGRDWTLVPLTHHAIARGLATGPDGTVYVGGVDGFGYLAHAADGTTRYVALSDDLVDTGFGNVWHVLPCSWGTVFVARDRVFVVRADAMDSLPIAAVRGIVLNDRVLLLARAGGFHIVDAQGARPFAVTQAPQPEGDRVQLLPLDGGRFACLTADAIWLHFPAPPPADTSTPAAPTTARFSEETAAWLRAAESATALALRDGRRVVGTRHGGLAVLNAAGDIVLRLDRSNGLTRNQVNHLYEDLAGNLWVAQSSGLTLVALDAPLTVYRGIPSEGFEGPRTMLRHDGTLYLAADNGLFALHNDRFTLLHRAPTGIVGLHAAAGNLYAADHRLLRVTAAGVTVPDWPNAPDKITALGAVPSFPDHLYLGTRHGLVVAAVDDMGRPGVPVSIDGVPDRVVALANDGDGRLLAATRSSGPYCLTLGDTPTQGRLTALDPGPQHGPDRMPVWFDGRPLVLTDDGVYGLDTAGRPIPDARFAGLPRLWSLGHGADGLFAADAFGLVRLIPDASGRLHRTLGPASRLGPGTHIADGADIWYLTDADVFRVTDAARPPRDTVPAPLLQWVTVDGARIPFEADRVRIPSADAEVELCFAAADFSVTPRGHYLSRLEGRDARPRRGDGLVRLGPDTSGGRRRLEVSFVGADGRESAATRVTLHLPVGLWQRQDVRAGAALALLLALWAAAAGYRRLLKRRYARERRRFEALAQAKKLEALGRLARGVAHDFNGVLATIFTLTWRLREETRDAAVPALADHIEQAGTRGRDLIRNILSFARPGLADRVPVRLDRVTEEALALTALTVPPGVNLRRPEGAAALWVLGNETACRQVVVNLCDNAVRALPGHGDTVTVTLAADDACVRLTVGDNGVGMDAETRDRVFEPYFTTRAAEDGTGLGLTVVAGIVAGMGGRIDVAPRPGGGTTFCVSLPRAADPEDGV